MSCAPRPAIIPGDKYHIDLFNKKDYAGTWERKLESSGLIELSPGSYIPWRSVRKRDVEEACVPPKQLVEDSCRITKHMEEARKLYNMRKYRPGCHVIDSCTKKVRQNYCWYDDGSLIPFAKPCRCLPPGCEEGTPYTVPCPLKVRRPPLFEWHCGTVKPVYAFVEYPKEDKAGIFGATIMKYVPLETVACLRNKAKAEALYSAMWKFPKCGADGPPRTVRPDCKPIPMKYTCKLAFPDSKPCPFYPMTCEEADRRGLCHPCCCY